MLILIVGPSGAGKDTLLNGARAALAGQAGVRFVRRVITRPGDAGEEAHESVSAQEFALRQAACGFALSWHVHGLHYGIPADITRDLAEGSVVIASVSRTVVAEAAEQFPVAVIEVTAPAGVLQRRLLDRGREDADAVADRLARAVDAVLPADRQVVCNDGTPEQGVARLVEAIRNAAGLGGN